MTASIEDAIVALAQLDSDGARIRNDVGFNGADTNFGRSLAFQIARGKPLSARQLAAAHRMLRKYQRQLTSLDIDYNALAAPPAPVADDTVTGLASMGGGFIAVTFSDYPKGLLGLVKSVPGARYDGANKTWRLPIDPITAGHIETWPPAILVEPEVSGWIRTMTVARAESVDASRATDADLDLEVASRMFPFQRAGVRYAVEHERTFIGDDMGLGKTVQALATIEYTDTYPALLVVPAVVKLNWRNEVAKWFPHRTVTIISGRAPALSEGELFNDAGLAKADLYVVNYDILSSWVPRLGHMGFGAVVFDESHYLKSPTAQRTKAAKAIAGKTRYRLLLTGTPVLNRPSELVGQLDVMGRLTDFGGARAFQRRYCDAHQGRWGWDANGASNLPELHERLRSTCMVRRTKDQVLTELPAKVRASVPLELRNHERYDKVKKDLKVWLKKRILEDDAFWASLRDTANADAEAEIVARRKREKMRRAEALVMIEALRQTVAEEKLDAALAWIDDFLESGSKLVAFAHHTFIIRAMIERYGDRAVAVYGDTGMEDRQAAVERFQADDTCRLFIGNIQAAGVGITLTAASDVAFLELPWRPGDLSQAEDRCHRIGQSDSVTCWYLLAADTIEQRIAGMLDAKRAVVDATTDGKQGVDPAESIQSALLTALERDDDDQEGW